MNTHHHCSTGCTNWLTEGLVGTYADLYIQYLNDRKYAPSTVRNYLASVAHFAQWASSKKLRLQQINEASVIEFLDIHLPACCCARPAHRERGDLSAALGHLLIVLRSKGVIAPWVMSDTSADRELRDYDEYMEHVRGLAPKTRSMALRIVKRLLDLYFDDSPIDMTAIRPEHVCRFYAQQAKLYSKPANTGSIISSLRGYFRYRASRGDVVHGLIGAISYPANWQLSSLPKTLTNEEVDQLVSSLGQPGRSMRRNDAIVRCALDLGLRSSEVAKLSLDDINWQAGTITLRRTKGRREDVLPLPATTGDAIAAYLQHERPVTTLRAIFVRLIAPCDQPVGPDLVRKSIRQAYSRAGLPYTKSHLLRHTMANRLLAGGASLKEVADVLRHRSLNTTLIYAKLDSRKLVEVALPWPGGTI